jgi:hypothetical protein
VNFGFSSHSVSNLFLSRVLPKQLNALPWPKKTKNKSKKIPWPLVWWSNRLTSAVSWSSFWISTFSCLYRIGLSWGNSYSDRIGYPFSTCTGDQSMLADQDNQLILMICSSSNRNRQVELSLRSIARYLLVCLVACALVVRSVSIESLSRLHRSSAIVANSVQSSRIPQSTFSEWLFTSLCSNTELGFPRCNSHPILAPALPRALLCVGLSHLVWVVL